MKQVGTIALLFSLLSLAASLTLAVSSWTSANRREASPLTTDTPPVRKSEDIMTVSPALDQYTQGLVRGDLWKRPDLSPRDRSIVTLAALVARNQAAEMPYYIDLALDHGVKPGEVSELITHLAFYSGWGNAMSALPVAKEVFEKRPR